MGDCVPHHVRLDKSAPPVCKLGEGLEVLGNELLSPIFHFAEFIPAQRESGKRLGE